MKIMIFCLAVFLSLMAYSQKNIKDNENPNAFIIAGGDAKSYTGSLSYSVGQVFYDSLGNNGDIVNQGVQQPANASDGQNFDIVDVANPVSILAYPNPVVDYLIIDIENYYREQLSYQIYDLRGRLIEEKDIHSETTKIKASGLSSSTYLVRVTNTEGKSLKTFKILKS